MVGARCVVVALAAVMWAGCVSEPGDHAFGHLPGTVDTAADFDWRPLQTAAHGVPCTLTGPVGAETSPNLRDLALEPLDGNGDVDHGEIDVANQNGSRLLVSGRPRFSGGFEIVDITDPRTPVPSATWFPPDDEYTFDVKFTKAGDTVVVAGYDTIRLVDVRDPSEPLLEYTYRLERPAAHMVTVFEVGGVPYLAASKGEGLDISIFRIDGGPGRWSMSRVAHPSLTPLGSAEIVETVHSHDTWFENDPALGKPVLWVANVWWGVVALDVSDPASPVEIARIPNADPYQGYTHTAQVTHIDGHRYVVASQEYGTPALKVWDATDLRSPSLVGVWNMGLPTKPQHNLQVVGSLVYLSHFEDGVYVFDLARISNDLRMQPVAHLAALAEPGPVPRQPAEPGFQYTGAVDVVLREGVLWVSEADQGLRSVLFGCVVPGDPGASSTG